MKKDQIIRTQNVQRHEVCWFIKPPINGPRLGPIYMRNISLLPFLYKEWLCLSYKR
jgi:hypothetical protein